MSLSLSTLLVILSTPYFKRIERKSHRFNTNNRKIRQKAINTQHPIYESGKCLQSPKYSLLTSKQG